jgi:RNA polymerase sigma factor (sigma-70 family)
MTVGSKEKGLYMKRTGMKELCPRWSEYRKRSAEGSCIALWYPFYHQVRLDSRRRLQADGIEKLMELPQDFTQEIRQVWQRFLQRTEPLRPDLHRYCRALTGSIWDAEDLVQDTLLHAFARPGEISLRIDNPKAYLFRIASNLWVDHFRRTEEVTPEDRSMTSNPEQSMEIRDAAKQLLLRLSPQERAAVVLKDVFDFRLEEIATILQITVGAIKAALHGGREKLAAPSGTRAVSPVSEALLDQFVAAFNARDLERVTVLLRADAVGEIVSMGIWYGRSAVRDVSLYYSLFLEHGEPRAERRTFLGEPIVVI